MRGLVFAAADAPAVEFQTEWNTTAWVLWLAFSAVALVLLWYGPVQTGNGGSFLWGIGAVAGWIFLFPIAYPIMARHADPRAAAWLFGVFMVVALITWAAIALNSGGGLPMHLIGGAAPAIVLMNGLNEGLTRNAANAGMSVGGYLGLGLLILAIIWLISKKS